MLKDADFFVCVNLLAITLSALLREVTITDFLFLPPVSGLHIWNNKWICCPHSWCGWSKIEKWKDASDFDEDQIMMTTKSEHLQSCSSCVFPVCREQHSGLKQANSQDCWHGLGDQVSLMNWESEDQAVGQIQQQSPWAKPSHKVISRLQNTHFLIQLQFQRKRNAE